MSLRLALLCLAVAPVLAQEPTAPMPLNSADSTSTALVQSALPIPEQRVRAGIVILQSLHDTMAGINDQESADAAVAPIMRLRAALHDWAQSFAALPPLTEAEQQMYEEQYLPIFKKLNNRIRTQGERLAAAEYYGSRDLPAALIQLALLNQ